MRRLRNTSLTVTPVWTDSIPIQLKVFLEQNGSHNYFPKEPLNFDAEREDLHVVFGPNNCFVAWDDTQIEWHGIPEDLGNKLCAWRDEYGNEAAMPRIVALGAHGAWFIVNKAGKAAYYFPEHGFELLWQDIAKIQAREGFAWKDPEVAFSCLSALAPTDLLLVLYDASDDDRPLCHRGDRLQGLQISN